MGLADARHLKKGRRTLSRASRSPKEARHILLTLLIRTFAPEGPLVFGLDDTIERRWLSRMMLAPVPSASRVRALPFLTVPAPSERYARERGRRHKTLLDHARQILHQHRRRPPEREIIVVGDDAYAAIERLAGVRRYARVITRLRLDAALYRPATYIGTFESMKTLTRCGLPNQRATDPAFVWQSTAVCDRRKFEPHAPKRITGCRAAA